MHLFIITHLGSDASIFCNSLHTHPYIKWNKFQTIYSHPTDIPLSESFGITFDKLEFNHSLRSPCFYNYCKFIYFIREPKQSIPSILDEKYSLRGAVRYYSFRLRRMYEMIRKTDGIVLSWEDKDLYERIGKYLGINPKFDNRFTEPEKREIEISREWLKEMNHQFLSMKV